MNSQLELADVAGDIGRDLGVSDWLTVGQEHIDRFAALTGDDQWIHVDIERAQREIGGTVAHGFLTLSMLTALAQNCASSVEGATRRVNYGFDKVRFTNFVPAGARIRLRQTLTSAVRKPAGMMTIRHCVVEIEGEDKPALVADWLTLLCE
jgi:acyl dehydratase